MYPKLGRYIVPRRYAPLSHACRCFWSQRITQFVNTFNFGLIRHHDMFEELFLETDEATGMRTILWPTNLHDIAHNDTVNSLRWHFACRQGSPGSKFSQVGSCEVFQKASVSPKGRSLSSHDEHTYGNKRDL